MIKIVPAEGSKYTFAEFACKDGTTGRCQIRVTTGKQYKDVAGSVWHWDGNAEKPTIQPSIRCDKCGLHVNVVAGVAKKA